MGRTTASSRQQWEIPIDTCTHYILKSAAQVVNAVAELFQFVGKASDVLSQAVGTELGTDTPRFMLEQVCLGCPTLPGAAASIHQHSPLRLLPFSTRTVNKREVNEVVITSSVCASRQKRQQRCHMVARRAAELQLRCMTFVGCTYNILVAWPRSNPHEEDWPSLSHHEACSAPICWSFHLIQLPGGPQAGLYAIMGCMRARVAVLMTIRRRLAVRVAPAPVTAASSPTPHPHRTHW